MLISEKTKKRKVTDETLLATFYKSEHFDNLSLQVGPFYCPQSIRTVSCGSTFRKAQYCQVLYWTNPVCQLQCVAGFSLCSTIGL